MKNNYALYYTYQTLGDVLIVIFDNEKSVTSHIRKNNVEVIYHDDEIIGYNIFNIQNVLKIRSQGLIYLPSKEFIEVINTILINAKVEPLDIKKESGYVIGQIIDIKELENDKYLLSVDIKEEIINTIIKTKELAINQKVVVAKVGTRLNDGGLIKQGNINGNDLKGHICSEKELSISDLDKILILDDEEEIGTDFFMMEEKK